MPIIILFTVSKIILYQFFCISVKPNVLIYRHMQATHNYIASYSNDSLYNYAIVHVPAALIQSTIYNHSPTQLINWVLAVVSTQLMSCDGAHNPMITIYCTHTCLQHQEE